MSDYQRPATITVEQAGALLGITPRHQANPDSSLHQRGVEQSGTLQTGG